MAAIKKAYADTPLGQVHYRYTTAPGTKKYPILFLHMSASSSACFDKLMTMYSAQGYQCWAPDMPGFGQSFDPVEDPPNVGWYVDLYAGIFGAIPAFADGCHLVGHHSGAVLGMEMAGARRGPSDLTIRSLTLCGPLLMDKAARDAMLAQVGVPFNRPTADGAHLLKTWDYLVEHGGIPRDDLDVLQPELLDHARAWRGRVQIYRCVFAQDGRALFPQVRCPVLALCARDDVLWPAFGEVKKLRPDVQAEEVTGANFGPSRGTDSMAAFLTPFLDKAEQS
ncbi:Alpha/Beta hydrolase protein [Xylariales sp. PMI_506]|nr:Alpha/Beta hydrolase protein [Xylariales sp. PMI_506]